MNISMSLAMTMAGPIPSRRSSMNPSLSGDEMKKDFSLYKGISNRPLGWMSRRASTVTPRWGSTSKDMSIRRWDGASRTSAEWDGLRRDPELWYSNGNCLVHLYGRGQSQRGPAFRVPIEKLLAENCLPLLDRFLVRDLSESSTSSNRDGGYYGESNGCQYEMYIPPPPAAEGGQTFLYHTATRNFFAWVFRKSLVGSHLGGALVGLLNSMTEFRSAGEDNVQDILDYMDEEGYADMRNQPDHALGVLFFAEHFQFKDLWIDSFAHCTGMHERLAESPGFEFMSRTSRALTTRSRIEMNVRLDNAGRMLGSFLSDDLSDTFIDLPSGAWSHLDKFRSFLQSHYVSKLGYYPPSNGSFPKHTYGQMCCEFQKLYNLLVNTEFSNSDTLLPSQHGGICVLQSVQAFDARHKFTPLDHALPLLPAVESASAKSPRMRFGFSTKGDKMKPDPRLVAFSSLTKATNRKDQSLYDCTLVRAYREFERECIFNPSKADKHDKLSQIDARNARWILIYSILQTLLSVTRVPEQVRDTQNVPYHLCVLTAGCPTWIERPIETLLRTQTDQCQDDFNATQSRRRSTVENIQCLPAEETMPNIDYFAMAQKQHDVKSSSASTFSSSTTTKGTVRRALSTLGNMPELLHPKPYRASFHEILVENYGNGTNTVSITAEQPSVKEEEEHHRENSTDSDHSSEEDLTSWWSHSDAAPYDSPRTSITASRRGSDASMGGTRKSIKDFLDSHMTTKLARIPSSVYSVSIYGDDPVSMPDPLSVRKNSSEEFLKVTTEVTVEWEDVKQEAGHEELARYLHDE